MNTHTQEWLDSAQKTVVSITSGDGLKLVGDVFNTDTVSHKWLIAIHGYTGKREHMYSYARYYAEKGYNILTPDMRSHGDSEGKLIGMGWLDKDDVKLWIDYVLDLDPEAEIVLHGVSMGGATDMVYSLFDVCPTRKDILVVDGAGHGQSLYLDPEQYFDKVFGFINSL